MDEIDDYQAVLLSKLLQTVHSHFRELTIIAIIGLKEKKLLKLNAIFLTALYVIYNLKRIAKNVTN